MRKIYIEYQVAVALISFKVCFIVDLGMEMSCIVWRYFMRE